ncbi:MULTISPECIES: bifunctional adenosylcobinamide kinase/adenosylcobinamide-phosphate guanylyltransferase [Clostridium]|uniref:Adenosylcobinamide kinase n=1 Tax=Clostridium cibarium TaxID=2762247 RepID=A0ABR8PXV1_9CLOT|nr:MULTISPECIES: bifunctional adenosylcobinamide kinase/adenosylcobinamide-phosphate guanylyltransferase [Clostridium]MBD7912990.1 bifunctional adenosylcobinamide kinase/adenosylcobinamide-phosphate guanylyltransferase [Clostridium cibarium]
MIFIIGGEFQGKLQYTLDLTGFDESNVADGLKDKIEDFFEKPIIYNFHLLIRRLLEEKKDIESIKDIVRNIIKENPEVVIISNEIGYGIVPIEKFHREYREATGRICCEVAKNAKEVHRVVCGIGNIIKEDEND